VADPTIIDPTDIAEIDGGTLTSDDRSVQR
jgi:hypothetical protein